MGNKPSEKIDQEWLELILEALRMGIREEEIKLFLMDNNPQKPSKSPNKLC